MSTVAVAAQQHTTESRTHSLANLAEQQQQQQQQQSTIGSAFSAENGHSPAMPCAPCPSSQAAGVRSAVSPESSVPSGCDGGGGADTGSNSNSSSSSSSSSGNAMANGQTDTSAPSGGGGGADGQQQQQMQQQQGDSSQQQQDQPPISGPRPASGGRQQRIAGGKGKHLTRSHAMRESTSPPRTPTPRSPSDTHTSSSSSSNPISGGGGGGGSTGGTINTTTVSPTTTTTNAVATSSSSTSGNNNNNNIGTLCNGPQSQPERGNGASASASTMMSDTDSLAKHNSSGPGGGGGGVGGGGGSSGNGSPNIVLFTGGEEQRSTSGKSQLDLDFPKLTPPKTSFNPNAGSNGSNQHHPKSNGSVKNNGGGKANGAAAVCETDKSTATSTGTTKQQSAAPTVVSTVGSPTQPGGSSIDTPDGGGAGRGGGMPVGPTNPSNHNHLVSGEQAMGGEPTTASSDRQQHSPATSPANSSSNYCDSDGRHGPYQHQQQREVNFSSSQDGAATDGPINIQFSHETETRYIQCDSPTDGLMRSGGVVAGTGPTATPPSGGKKRSGASGKGGNKAARLKNLSGGSSSSVDGGGGGLGGGGGMASFMSRDSLCDPFTDQSGVNLLQFFKETLNKNFKDRNMLMKIEKELLSLAMDRSRSQMKFPPMSSYNRMLIHRVAAYFGMEHNVDATQQCVIAEVTPATRIPDIRFKNLISDSFSEEPRKSILKRDTHSFDEYHRFGGGGGGDGGGGGGGGGGGRGGGSGLLHCPDRGMLDRKAKSFEERDEEYDKSKRRLFKNREHDSESDQWQWISTDGVGVAGGGGGGPTLIDVHAVRHQQKLQNNRLLKVQSVSIEGRSDERPCVSKSHSFGGYGGSSQNASLLRGDSITSTKSAGARLFTKQDSNASTNTPWRLSPSSSGSYLTSSYKTQSIRSDSVTPSPTGYGSGDHTPEPCVPSPSATCGVMWAVTDMASVPKGSVLIDPQTFQPIVNQDGSLYHFDPSNLPPTATGGGPWPAAGGGKVSKRKFEKQKSFNSKNNLNSSSSLESSIDGPVLGKSVDCGLQTAIPADNGSGAVTTIMTMTASPPTTIAEEVVNELGCYDAVGGGTGGGGLKLLSVKDNPDMDENSSLCEEISQTTNELGALKLQKHQATSPMLQASELQPIDMNEIQYGTNPSDSGSLVHTANTTTLLDEDRSLIDEVAETTGDEPDDLGDTLDALGKTDPTGHNNNNNNPALGAAVQLLHVHDPVSSSSTLDAADDDDDEDDDEDRSETPTDGGQEEVDKKNDMVKVANVVQTVVPLTSYASASATPNGGGSAGVSAYTVTYDGGGSGHPGTTVYATGTPGLSTTTYQTAPDGAIYAVPSSLVYTYPTAMDPAEMSGGYFVPVYDPQQQQREASLCSTPGASIYSAPAGAASTVLHPIAYTQSAAAAAAYTGAPLYQNPVMYSSDQFPAAQAAAAAAAAGQLSQYPISYPIGIGYPFNGATYQNYWNQPITYYVPQTPVPSTVGGASILMPPPMPQTPGTGGIITTTATVPTNTPGPSGAPMAGKRNTTPPQNGGHGQSQGGATHSASVTPVPISPFATNIPVPLPDTTSAAATGAPMYAAFPQPLYPNMLPFASPMATHPHPAAAPAGTLVPTAASFHPHPVPTGAPQHHPSAHHPAAAASGPHADSSASSGGQHHPAAHYHHHHQQQQQGQQGGSGHYSSTNGPSNGGGGGNSSSSSSSSNSSHSGGNHSNNSATNAPTPQSTPSTPLSLPLSMPPHHGGVPAGATPKGMPLFPTPPIMPNVAGGGGYAGHHHYASSDDRKPGNGGGYKPRGQAAAAAAAGSNGGPTGGSYFNYNASSNGRQMTPNSTGGGGNYQPQGGMKGGYAQNNTGNNNQNQNGPLILGPPPSGKLNRHDGSGQPNAVPPANGNSSNNNKPPLIPTLPSMVVPGATAPNAAGLAGDKARLNRSSKPPNLDLKRSYNSNSYGGVNSRNTPSTNSNESNGSPNSITSSSVHEHGAAQSHHPMVPHHAHHHAGGHGGAGNHPTTPTSHHHAGSHPVVSAGGGQQQPAQQHGGLHHHHHPGHPAGPHGQHHPHHGGGGGQSMAHGVPQQAQHGGPGGGGGATHYYHAGGGQSMAQAGGGGQVGHSGQSSYYASNGPSHRGGSVGSNGGGNGAAGSGSGGNGGGHGAGHPHAMPAAAVMHNSAVAAAAAAAAAVEPYHQQLIPINAATGMSYVKIGQAYYPSLTLPQSRRSPPNEIRPIAGVYPTMNMVMPASRQFTPRPQHSSSYSNAKVNKSLR
uniref:protein encore isoform X2 n=1 Tax=Anopheles coluzzii TaxID=1518534 RepID=UPI0020FFAC7B|nr:protein encore isoform X2 [Anopheles coluzzii]